MTKKNTQTAIADETLMGKIYIIRGHKIMLDKDLAELYDVKPIRLREQVKRNIGKFPAHFMFQLTEEETGIMVSQNAIPSKQHLGGFLPYVFTEHGVLQLANVLRSERATQMSIRIIEVFIKMREILLAHKDILLQLEQLEKQSTRHSKEIQYIFDVLKQLVQQPNEPRKQIGFKAEKKENK